VASAEPRLGARILLVDDEESVRIVVTQLLERAGMQVRAVEDGPQALRAMYEFRPDLMVLDVNMPGMSGWELLGQVRVMSDLPVIMLTAKSREMEKVRGLDEGASDYVTKPFGSQELLARVRAALRGAHASSEHDAEQFADQLVEIDFARATVHVDGQELRLTRREFDLLATFARNRGRVLSNERLYEEVWGEERGFSPDQVKLYVSYLRRKLGTVTDSDPIVTVRGFGYRYEPPA